MNLNSKWLAQNSFLKLTRGILFSGSVLAGALSGTALYAQQSTGDVLGTVTDSSGASIPGAVVTLTNVDTNDVKTLKTSDGGNFDFANLNPGKYKLIVAGQGFRTATTNDLTVSAGDRRRVDTKMVIGGSTETIEVSTRAATLQTDSSTMQNTVGTEAVANLPLNGRNYVSLVQITPGATEGNPTSIASGNGPDDRRQGSSVSINSQSDVLNNNMIDGLDNNERIIGTIGVRPSIEGIQEVKILTNTFTADSGRAAGAVVNVITKSGSNQFHGSLFEYFRNDKLNAYAFQFGGHNRKPELRQNQFGGSLGGPIWKDHTFFFGDADFLRVIQVMNPGTATVPNSFEQNNPGNFSDIVASQFNGATNPYLPTGPAAGVATVHCNPGGAAILDPSKYVGGCAYNQATGFQYANNVIPTSAIDPVGLNYFKLYSLPTVGDNSPTGTANYVGSGKRQQYVTNYDVRVDHKISSADQIFGRYSVNDVYTVTPTPSLPPKMVAGLLVDGQNAVDGTSPQLDRNAQINFSHTFTPNVLLTLGAGWTFVQNYSYPPNYGNNPNTAFGEPGVNFSALSSALGGVTFGNGLTGFGAGRPGFVPLLTKDNTYQGNGALFYTRGKQSFKMGGALIRRLASNFQEQNGTGNIAFSNGAPGLLTGAFSSSQRNNNPFGPSLYRVWEPSGFIQDDIRVAQNLTLNLGVRYDVFTPYTEKNNRIANFLPNQGGLVAAGVNGVSRTAGVPIPYSDVAPRIGFAYTARPRTVIRGGFGLAFFTSTQASPASLKDQPFAIAFGPCSALTCPAPFNSLRNGLPVPGTESPASLALNCVTGVTSPVCYTQSIVSSLPSYRDSYLEQFNLTMQQELLGKNVLTVAYVGVLGRHLGDALGNVNLAPLGYTATASGPAGRAFFAQYPNLTTVAALTTTGSSSYNGLQATLQRTFSNGLGYTATTTWAHELDNVGQIGGGGSLTAVSVDPNSPYFTSSYDYGSGDLDQRNRFVFTGNYSPAFTHGFHGVAKQLLDGWQGNVIAVWTTGLPFSPANTKNVSNTSPGNGSDRPNLLSNPFSNVPAGYYFNPASYAAQAAFTVGNSRRNYLHGPAGQHVDIGLGKAFPIHENYRLNFKAEGFNMLNSVIFSNPGTTVGSSTFGKITSTRADYNPRAFQFALRLEF